MAYPETGSTLTWDNGNNRTKTALSTHILIKVGGQAVGAVQSIQINETRTIKMIDEVGTDGSIDSTPQSSSKFSGTIKRVRFDGLRGANAFGRGFVHVQSQQYPFDIEIIDRQKTDPSNWAVTTLKNVWFKSISYSHTVNDWIIVDDIAYDCETIYSTMKDGDKGIAGPGARGLKINYNAIETMTDTGKRRGSMDASGLFDVGKSLIWTP